MDLVQTIQQSDISRSVGRQQAKREATERGIIDAFERLLLTKGAAGLGVNALVKEAGIGKRQLYAYFGGLPGVATAWIKQRDIWPSLDSMRGEDRFSFARRSATEKIRIINQNYAEALRANPPLCELLTGEFTRTAELKEAIEHVRQLVRRDFERLFAEDMDLAGAEIMELNAMAYAAATYLAMRSNAQPMFFGLDLSSQHGWDVALGMFTRVIEGAPMATEEKVAA